VAQNRRHAKAPTRASNLRTFYIILAVLAVGGVGWIAYSLVGGGTQAAVNVIDLQGLDDPQALISAARGQELGDANAPVKVLVFSDFTCPACKSWSTRIEPQLKSEFVNAGKVRLVYYDFPLGPGPGHVHGFVAARAARCAADQSKFWEYHDVLFARQTEWTFAESAPLGQFEEFAGLVGLDTKAFEACLNSQQHADLVSANRKLGDNLGVNATPTVFIGTRSLGPGEWNDWERVRAAVQRELGS
jgi:protein-disulfide isomerase